MKSYLFINGSLYHPHQNTFVTQSLLTENGLITCVADEGQCRNQATTNPEVIDLQGRLLLPAFTDCHTHFVEYAKSRFVVNLDGLSSLDAMDTYLENYRQQLQVESPWILGWGWDRNLLANPLELNRTFLDKVFPDKPVALMSKDYHAKLCNTLALRIAGINTDTKAPSGGRIERDADGLPTGVLFETAVSLIDPFIVLPHESVIMAAIRDAIHEIYRWGLAGFHTMENRQSYTLLSQLQTQGLPFRFCWHFPVEELEKVASEGMQSYAGDGKFTLGGMKIFGDGSLGSRTAAMFEPYDSEPGNNGILRQSDSELWERVERAAQLGFGSTIHAIGNRCVHQVLSTIIRLKDKYPHLNLFHRLEHVQSIRPEDIPLMRSSGVFASVQPCHLANDVPMINNHWRSIAHQAYTFASLLRGGIGLGFGSDAPIESINPFVGIYAAVYRRPAYNPHLSAFNPAESLSVAQAINGYTLGAAASSCSTAWQGTLEPGKVADLIVIDDFRHAGEDYWLHAGSKLTMVAGEIVYSTLY